MEGEHDKSREDVMSYRCLPIETAVADRFRWTGRDDAGDKLRRVAVHRVPGGATYPCRHCLSPVADGRDALLGSYRLERPRGAYWTPSPVFVCADFCRRFDGAGGLPPFMRHVLLAVRAYDALDQMIYPLSDVAPGAEAEALIERDLADLRTRYLNLHTARYGCFLCRVERP
jgi:hypothetical protein